MKTLFTLLGLIVFFQSKSLAQESLDSIQEIEEVLIQSQRIAVPFQKKSNSINLITKDQIKKTTASTTDEILQLVSGVDVRTRGIEGMQSDLYIRGGNFNQVLLLIDGIKMDDLQSGHHTMNGIIDLESIEQIEIIKGAAARIYGQNAMNGAINIVTKKINKDKTKIKINSGSYQNWGAAIGFQKVYKEVGIQLQVNKNSSKGYRYNTDFNNFQTFFKANWKNHKLIASFAKRNFGANGFYASPDYKDQYEETQTNLIALKSKYTLTNWTIKPNIYWRQNQDMYVFIRANPSFYRNFHINNKVGISVNASIRTQFGMTGVGVDINKGLLRSNNLGNRDRLTSSLFIEHRFEFLHSKLDLTPGINLTNFSDFDFFSFPGLNMGYELTDNVKLYGNIGYTFRIPTYTNLYYNSSIEKGNPNLKPEKALTYETGLKLNKNKWFINLVYFNRKSIDLIDWVKENKVDKWKAYNIGEVITNGFETETNFHYTINKYQQRININYTYLSERILDFDKALSRYAINSYKHQLTSSIQTQFFPFLNETISYRYAARIDGADYHILDMALSTQLKRIDLSLKANNILNQTYTETNLVPMPRFNFMTAVSYSF
jgi:iron complex outermembrane receptor protein